MLNLGIPGLQDYLRGDYSSGPYIPGMDMGNMGGVNGPKPKEKTGNIFDIIGFPGGGGNKEDGNKKPDLGDILGLPGGGDKKEEESMADVWGRFIGKSTLKDHTNQMADIGKEAMGIKYGLDTTQKAIQQISANNVWTGGKLIDSADNYGRSVMAMASKQQPAFNTQFRGMTPLKYSFFMG